ncbi:MAG: 1-acyl-sn-glycerol-3-phosphate acyltransferase [Simkaniaceae bacterium]|nr:1-acyl-sn-glycerol-3-phosphate acyltransferase [Simkaniaceae bacterium]
MSEILGLLEPYEHKGTLPPTFFQTMRQFLLAYERVASSHGFPFNTYRDTISDLLKFCEEQIKSPHQFAPFHQAITAPIDYRHFGYEMLRPLIDWPRSTLEGEENLDQIVSATEAGENVILLANHQIEADPQAIGLLLEKSYSKLAHKMIFVAGERVVTDPLAIPFSMGCNLLCIYSKRYIDNPPEKKEEKTKHNSKTMQLMADLLKEGGKCIYVAPSGGRDRRNLDGHIDIAPFDPKSVEMFKLMAKRSGTKTHFHPLTLATYSVLPPPETIQVELGEARTTEGGAVHIHFGSRLDMDHFPGASDNARENRQLRADYIHGLIKKAYLNFSSV